ncbi:MAG TPA: hypothetical protein VFD70_18265 [Anaerolineae bacterium]|nr:hypothetical protein [Anaerolineae bacterium]
MSSLPPGTPEPVTPRDKPLPPRGRDRALSAPTGKENAKKASPAPTPYEYGTGDGQAAATAAKPLAHLPALPPAPSLVRRHWLVWLIVLSVVGVAVAFTLPFTLGVYFGNQDREAFLARQAQEHFQRALAYESETFNDLAIAELNAALQYKPDYAPARAKLVELKNASTAKADQEPQDVAIAKQLFDSAQDALAKQDWNNAIDLLEELHRVKNDYQATQVTAELVSAYVNAGKEAIAANDVDLAQRRFLAALALAPNNAEAKMYNDRALLYVNGTHALGTDWLNAVLTLEELYQRDPNFADVKLKLRQAHIGYGETANTQGAFCIAARELNAALALGSDAATETLASQANESCKQAILNPTPTFTPTPEGGVPTDEAPSEIGTPFPPPVLAGNLVYVAQMRVRQSAACNGTGNIKGSVKNNAGTPIPNVGIKIYNDYGYMPPFARTNEAGEYEIVLGSDKGLFHLVVVDDFGSNVSAILDVDYPGGNVQGCHIVVDWTRTR